MEFLPGQWLDVHIPNIKHAGGFTITSTPQDASTQGDIDIAADGNDKHQPYVELAVQYSPSNPAAKWFWQPIEQILGAYVKVRIGGRFVWPPPNGMALDEIKNIVFVAGGVGIKYDPFTISSRRFKESPVRSLSYINSLVAELLTNLLY